MSKLGQRSRQLDRPEVLVPYLVRKGIAMLDLFGPTGWRDRVNVDTLNMGNPRFCVLGQLYAAQYDAMSASNRGYTTPYGVGRDAIHAASSIPPEDLDSEELMRACGFLDCWSTDAVETDSRFRITPEMLTDAWLTELSRPVA